MNLEIFVFLVIILIHFDNSFCDSKVKMVFTLFRHGARTPYYLKYGVDSFGNNWDYSRKDLTYVGRRQHYILGLMQREKYSGLLGDLFVPGEAMIYSTNSSRTIDSLTSHMKGLYLNGPISELNFLPPGDVPKPVKDRVKETNLDRQSGFSYRLFDDDEYFNFAESCISIKEYSEERNKYIEDNIKEFKDNYGDLLKAKFDIDINVNDIYKSRLVLWNFWDTYIACYYENKPRKLTFTTEEEEKNFVDDLEYYMSMDMLKGSYYDKDYYNSRILNSKMMNNIIKQFDQRIGIKDNKYDSVNPKMIIYSAHDSNVAPLLVFLSYAVGIKMNSIPYASMINIELIESSNDHFSIKILYNGEQLYENDYSIFKNQIKKAIISDDEIDLYCGWRHDNTFYIIMIVLESIIIVCGSIVLFAIGYYNSKNKEESKLINYDQL